MARLPRAVEQATEAPAEGAAGAPARLAPAPGALGAPLHLAVHPPALDGPSIKQLTEFRDTVIRKMHNIEMLMQHARNIKYQELGKQAFALLSLS